MTTKKMLKELVNHDYVTPGMKLSDGEIRRLYNEMIYDESFIDEETGDSTLNSEEESTMSKKNEATANTNAKEKSIMKNNNLAARVLNMNRTERLVYVWDIILHVTKTSDVLYIDKAELAQFLFDNDIISRMPGKNELKRTKRQEFVDILDTAVQNLIKNKVITPVGDLNITHDNAPEITSAPISNIDAVWSANNATAVLKIVIEMASTNHYITFISKHMVKSAIRNVLFGKFSKEKLSYVENGKKVVEYIANEFTPEQDALMEEFFSKFVSKYLLPYNNSGYTIGSLAMCWYYKKCIYRFRDKKGTVVDYIVDYKAGTLSRKGSDNPPIALTHDTYKKLDETTGFLQVVRTERAAR